MTARVFLNVDLGELPGEPDALYAYAHLANVACGGHAGDDSSMRRAVLRCQAHGAELGAHPSYPDHEGFGRRRMVLAASELRATVAEQCARLAKIAASSGMRVAYVKAHGALYHAAGEEAAIAAALVQGAIDVLGPNAIVVGPACGEVARAAARYGLRYAREAFADRRTLADGTLAPRDQPDALLLEPAVAADRARSLASGGHVDTVCVHSDTPGAVRIAGAVRAALDAVGE